MELVQFSTSGKPLELLNDEDLTWDWEAVLLPNQQCQSNGCQSCHFLVVCAVMCFLSFAHTPTRTIKGLSPAKTAEPVEMPLGVLTRVGPRNHVLDGVNIGRIHSQPGGVTSQRFGHVGKLCKKTGEPIEMPIWEPTHVGPRNNVLDGGQNWTNQLASTRG